MSDGVKVLAANKKARHDYFIEDTYEAGIELKGTEVKSLRAGKSNLRDSYVQIKNAEAFVCNMHISPYEKGNIFNTDPMRTRRLLLHKREILKLMGIVQQKGFTLVPLRVYLKGGRKLYDKREDLKEKAIRRDHERSYKIK